MLSCWFLDAGFQARSCSVSQSGTCKLDGSILVPRVILFIDFGSIVGPDLMSCSDTLEQLPCSFPGCVFTDVFAWIWSYGLWKHGSGRRLIAKTKRLLAEVRVIRIAGSIFDDLGWLWDKLSWVWAQASNSIDIYGCLVAPKDLAIFLVEGKCVSPRAH